MLFINTTHILMYEISSYSLFPLLNANHVNTYPLMFTVCCIFPIQCFLNKYIRFLSRVSQSVYKYGLTLAQYNYFYLYTSANSSAEPLKTKIHNE